MKHLSFINEYIGLETEWMFDTLLSLLSIERILKVRSLSRNGILLSNFLVSITRVSNIGFLVMDGNGVGVGRSSMVEHTYHDVNLCNPRSLISCWKTASAIGDRQMFPKQTISTPLFLVKILILANIRQ